MSKLNADLISDLSDEANNPQFQPQYLVGQNVFCKTGDDWESWQAGIIKEVKLVFGSHNECGYVCRLISGKKKFFSAQDCSALCLRPRNFDPTNRYQLLLHHLQWGAQREELISISTTLKLDLQIIGAKLLLITAQFGNLEAFDWLIVDHSIDPLSTDDKGRNILHLAVMNKQVEYLQCIGDCGSELKAKLNVDGLVKQIDNSGMNILHYIVMSNSEQMLNFCLASSNEIGVALRQSFGNESKDSASICIWKDHKGRSAVDYATLFNRTVFRKALSRFEKVCLVQRKLKFIVNDYTLNNHCEYQFSEFIKTVTDCKLKLNRVDRSEQFEADLQVIAYELCIEGDLEGLQWLVENYDSDLTYLVNIPSERNMQLRYEKDVATQALRGSYPHFAYDNMLDQLIAKYDSTITHSVKCIVNECFQQFLCDWCGERDTLDQYCQSKTIPSYCIDRTRCEYNVQSICNGHQSELPRGVNIDQIICLVDIKIQQLKARICIEHGDSEKRMLMLQWLIDRVKLPPPSIIKFILADSVVLFTEIYCCKRVTFPGFPPDDSLYHNVINCAFWFNSTDDTITPQQILCVLAVQFDSLQLFIHIFHNLNGSDAFLVGKKHWSLLHVAAYYGSYLITKYMLVTHVVSANQVNDSGETALCIAVRHGHIEVSLLLLKVTSSSLLCEGVSIHEYIHKSQSKTGKRLVHYAENAECREKLHKLIQNITSSSGDSDENWLNVFHATKFFDCLVAHLTTSDGTLLLPDEAVCASFFSGGDNNNAQHANHELVLCVIAIALSVELMDFFRSLFEVILQSVFTIENGLSAATELLLAIYKGTKQHEKTLLVRIADEMLETLNQLTSVSEALDNALTLLNDQFVENAPFASIHQNIQHMQQLFTACGGDKDWRHNRSHLALSNGSYEVQVDSGDGSYKLVPLFHYAVQKQHDSHIQYLLPTQNLTTLIGSVPCAAETGNIAIVKQIIVQTEKIRLEKFQSAASVTVSAERDSPPVSTSMLRKHHEVVESQESPTELFNQAIMQAIVIAIGQQHCVSFAEVSHSADVSLYLIEQAIVRGIDMNAVIKVKEASRLYHDAHETTLLQHLLRILVWHEEDSLCNLLDFILSNTDVFDLNTPVFDVKARNVTKPLVIDLFECFYEKFGAILAPYRQYIKDTGDEESDLTEKIRCDCSQSYDHFIRILKLLLSRGLHIYPHNDLIVTILEENSRYENTYAVNTAIISFLTTQLGLDVTRADFGLDDDDDNETRKLQKEQLFQFKEHDKLISLIEADKDVTIKPKKNFIFPYKRTLLHRAAIGNHVKLARILVKDDADIHAVDGIGNSVLDLAIKSGSTDVENLIRRVMAERVIAKVVRKWFLYRQYKKSKNNKRRAAIRIQALYRQHRVFHKYCGELSVFRSSWRQFLSVWGVVISVLKHAQKSTCNKKRSDSSTIFEETWSVIKSRHDIQIVETQSQTRTTDSVQDLMTLAASTSRDDSAMSDEEAGSTAEDVDRYHKPMTDLSVNNSSGSLNVTAKCLDNIEISQAVLKWLEGADGRYKSLFQDRVTRLAEGDRSYALSKRLKGCDYPIYETKLDSGQRILWTQLIRENKLSILVWFVSKHDDVNSFMQHIDKSYSRLAHIPLIEQEHDLHMLRMADDDVLLDPIGNCPLKVYTASRGDIPLFTATGWLPSLRLGAKQQEVQIANGTVLLLGRSGTGKTVCLCDRMTRDRQHYQAIDATCSQLFVSRSRRLCEFVKTYQEQQVVDKTELQNADFMTLDAFISHMEGVVTSVCGPVVNTFHASRRMTFALFCRKLSDELDNTSQNAIVVWTQIRSFIKGSIEAVMQRGPLTLEQYLDSNVFGLDRYRLQPEQRRKAYAMYKIYEDLLSRENMWDDSDRVMSLLTRSNLQTLCACNGKHRDYHKVYVDEVQDNTQAEIVLYFLAAGMNTQSLFLAGDPAQSVVEGVDFRFEDVRSIVYILSATHESIQRPLKLYINYRSHAGVLNCAAAILDKMFAMFPGSAKVLPRDAGLFKGPRPAYLSGATSLVTLLRHDEHLIVICLDEKVPLVEKLLNDYNLVNMVLGIRAAKGLEFQDVVLYDFFSSIPSADRKAWRNMLTEEHPDRQQPYSHPQIESQLKLLYTAITRSCNRLIFVESELTVLCSTFFRWLKKMNLAEALILSSEVGSSVMTCDEWRVRGIDFALSAEGDMTIPFLEKAVRCFEFAQDITLLKKAQTQLDILRFIAKLQECSAVTDEITAATLVLKGIEEHLLEEVKELCVMIADRSKEKSYFERHVLNIFIAVHL